MRQNMREPNNPTPKEWLSKDHSLKRIADYKPFNLLTVKGLDAVCTSQAACSDVPAVIT
jgi:hypothetical protein